MNVPFIPESPSQSSASGQAGGDIETPGSSTSGGTTIFNFAGLSKANAEMGDYPEFEENEQDPEEQKQESDKAASEASEKLLAQMRDAFRKKEVVYKTRIASLTQKISSANESCREK